MFKNGLQKILIITIILLGAAFIVPSAFAAGLLPACAQRGDCQLNDMTQVLINVSNWILGVVGSVALLFFVYGGFTFIFSGGNEEKVSHGKRILINSIIGLAIVFASFLIIKFSIELLGAQTTNTKGLIIEEAAPAPITPPATGQ